MPSSQKIEEKLKLLEDARLERINQREKERQDRENLIAFAVQKVVDQLGLDDCKVAINGNFLVGDHLYFEVMHGQSDWLTINTSLQLQYDSELGNCYLNITPSEAEIFIGRTSYGKDYSSANDAICEILAKSTFDKIYG